MTEHKVKLGDRVVDVHTGFEGTVMARAEYMYGCVQIQVQPKVKEDGDFVKHQWFDEPQLELVEDNGGDDSEPRHGGNRSHP